VTKRVLSETMKREYPDRPIVGVGGVVIHRQRALLIRRGCEPLKGQWSIPGGMLELGEELAEGVRRELKEETGLEVEPLEIVAAFDRIMREGKRVKYHYVIVDYVCRLKRGRLKPASDVTDARWVRREEMPQYHLTEMATKVILQSFEVMERQRTLHEPPVARKRHG
jgi:ADP-ribose pyrophosphatase YjhB (NUDIX family)